jgi:hypothetical protein
VTNLSPTGFTLSWTDVSLNGVDETGYELQEKNSNVYTTIATLPADATTYPVTGLAGGTAKTYRLRAVNGNGGGAYTTDLTTRTTGFNFSGSTTSVSRRRPTSGTVNQTATVRVNWGSSEPVTLSISGLPANVTAATFSVNPVTRATPTTSNTNVTLTLTLSSAPNVTGTFPLTITGTSSVHTTTHTLNLTIQP